MAGVSGLPPRNRGAGKNPEAVGSAQAGKPETGLLGLWAEVERRLLQDACRQVCSPGSASLTAGAEDRRILETLLQIRQLWFARQLRHAGVLIYADPQGG